MRSAENPESCGENTAEPLSPEEIALLIQALSEATEAFDLEASLVSLGCEADEG